MKKFKVILILAVFIFSFVSIFVCYDCVAKGVSSGLYLCADVIIPSFFPVLCITSFLSHSGVINVIGRYFDRASKTLFNMSGYFIPVFLLSLISGYPVGACISQTMYKNGRISLESRNNMSAVCCSAGPSFLLLAVGIGILNSYECGVALFVSHLLASIIVAIIVSRFFTYKYFFEKQKNEVFVADALVLGVGSACNSVISICAYTVLFSAVVNVISKYLRATVFYLPVVSLLEVTNAVYALSSQGVPLAVLSAVIGFGGFSVIFQISSALGNDRPPISVIILIRILHAAVSYVICSISVNFFDVTVPVFNNSSVSKVYTSENFLFSSSLMILLIVFLSFFNKALHHEKISYF